MKQKRKIPGRYFFIMAVLVMLVILVLLLVQFRREGRQPSAEVPLTSQGEAGRNTHTDQEEREDSGTETQENSRPVPTVGTGEKPEDVTVTPGPGEVADIGSSDPEQVPATGEGARINFDEYYWERERYTEITVSNLTPDYQWRDFVELENSESMKETMGANYNPEIYLESYLEQHGLEADTATVLLDRYQGVSVTREEYYVEFDDPAHTLVTVVYYPANGNHGCYIDVLPCQYTREEIQLLQERMGGEAE